MYKLNPVDSTARFVQEDYPRRFALTDEGKQNQESADVLTTTWDIESKDFGIIKDELPEVSLLDNSTVTINKGYGNIRYWRVAADESKTVDNLIQSARFNASERASVGNVDTLMQLATALEEIREPTEKHQELLVRLNERYQQRSISLAVANVLSRALPKFVYFRDYERLPGKVAINDLIRRGQQDDFTFELRIFQALLALVNSTAEEIADAHKSEQLIMKLEAISNRLSDEIFEYWSQNKHLRVEFRCDMARNQDPSPFNDG